MNTKLIMIIDDEDIVRDVLCTFFDAKGYQTVGLKNGQKAITFAETIKPDVILLDIKMPGLSGIETCYRLKQVLKSSSHTGIIIITGYASRENVEKAFSRGAIDVIRKPFDLEDVNYRINTWFDVRNIVSEHARIREYTKKVNSYKKRNKEYRNSNDK